jgi:hypothetical protein
MQQDRQLIQPILFLHLHFADVLNGKLEDQQLELLTQEDLGYGLP